MTGPQTEKEIRERRHGRAYQGAFESVFAILVAAGIGYWADDRFGTAPRYLLIGIAIGFCSFVLRLLRLGRELHRANGAGDADADR